MAFVNPKEIEAQANARANRINYMAQKRVLKVETQAETAVRSAFKTWCQKAPLSERQAFMATLKQYAKGITVDRINYYASLMEEAVENTATDALPAELSAASKGPKGDRITSGQAGEAHT
jgi:hypothetical protein